MSINNNTSSPSDPRIVLVRAPFHCPVGEGHLQRRDLAKFGTLVQTNSHRNPQDPESGLWYDHLSVRLLNAWNKGGDGRSGRTRAVNYLERYTELICQLNVCLSVERQQELRREKAVLEALALPPEQCGFCLKQETTEQRELLRCSRCKNQKYCGRDCQKQHWDTHKQCCHKIKTAHLQDTAEMQRRSPDLFQVPDLSELQEIEPGVLVKVCVPGDGTTESGSERFWVKVEAVVDCDDKYNPTKFLGRIDNVLVYTPMHHLKCRDRIEFEPHHVYQVLWPWRSKLGVLE